MVENVNDVFKILVVGDTHMNFNWFDSYVVPYAEEHGCRTIFVVGDFGFWENSSAGLFFLQALSKLLVEKGIRLIFLLGNHEDWDSIGAYNIADQSSEGFRKIRDNLWWAPCGLQWKWKNTSFGAVGGAYSIDRGVRILNKSYFLQEVIDDEKSSDIIDMTEPESVDIMLTHDVGSYVDMMHHMYKLKKKRIMTIAESFESRRQLQKIINHWVPDTVIHGHWHLNYQDKVDDIYYYGLDCEFKNEASLAVISIREDSASITLPQQCLSRKIHTRAEEASAVEK